MCKWSIFPTKGSRKRRRISRCRNFEHVPETTPPSPTLPLRNRSDGAELGIDGATTTSPEGKGTFMFDWIVALVTGGGYLSIAALMLLENVFPPIPSELVMPLAGFSAARGDLTLWGVIVAGTVGSVAGALLWYWIGLKLGEARLKRWANRHGRWLTIDAETIETASGWFRRHGGAAVFFGRMIPGVRTFISVPAGVAGMPMLPFLAFTTIGSALWTALLAVAGYLLESQYERVAGWLDPVSWVVVGLIVAAYLWRLIQGKGRRSEA